MGFVQQITSYHIVSCVPYNPTVCKYDTQRLMHGTFLLTALDLIPETGKKFWISRENNAENKSFSSLKYPSLPYRADWDFSNFPHKSTTDMSQYLNGTDTSGTLS